MATLAECAECVKLRAQVDELLSRVTFLRRHTHYLIQQNRQLKDELERTATERDIAMKRCAERRTGHALSQEKPD